MPFTLPDLPYKFDALESVIDAKTMEIHHDKHHAAYIAKLNDAIAKHPELENKSVEELLRDINNTPENTRTALKTPGGAPANLSFFGKIMSPKRKNPSGVF